MIHSIYLLHIKVLRNGRCCNFAQKKLNVFITHKKHASLPQKLVLLDSSYTLLQNKYVKEIISYPTQLAFSEIASRTFNFVESIAKICKQYFFAHSICTNCKAFIEFTKHCVELDMDPKG